MSGALDGVRVVDFSRVLAGPYATMLLGDLGADVVKVEQPGRGDDTRDWGPPYAGGQATYFAAVNRNKRSVALDLASEGGRRTARELVHTADVVVQNLRPGAMSRYGLAAADVAALNPRAVYCSISGFGTGAGADLPGYDLIAQAVGGLMSITGPPEEPHKAGVAVVDVITGLHATVGILAALRHRDRTGEAQQVDVNLLSSLLSALVNQASGYVGAGVVPDRMGNQHPSIAPYEVYPARDGALVLAVGNDRQFAALCAVLGLALHSDGRFATNPARVANREAMNAALEPAIGARDAVDWFERLSAAGVPCGPINDVAGAFALAQRLGLEPVVDAGGSAQVANPIRLGVTPPSYRLPPPELGADTVAPS